VDRWFFLGEKPFHEEINAVKDFWNSEILKKPGNDWVMNFQ
jgi:hypothetical protein